MSIAINAVPREVAGEMREGTEELDCCEIDRNTAGFVKAPRLGVPPILAVAPSVGRSAGLWRLLPADRWTMRGACCCCCPTCVGGSFRLGVLGSVSGVRPGVSCWCVRRGCRLSFSWERSSWLGDSGQRPPLSRSAAGSESLIESLIVS